MGNDDSMGEPHLEKTMITKKDLEKDGWRISDEGFDYLIGQFDDEPTYQDLNLLALDSDLRLFGESVISDKWPDKLVVQVQKVKNVSAPKINQYQQPKMILATITDGKTSAQMLEFERQSKLSVDTMPGTKILIQNPKFIESYIAINNSIRVLGGEVDKMIEKWLVERDSTSDQFRARSFEKRNKKGKYLDQEEDLSKRKTLGNDHDEENDNDEFEAERQAELKKIETVRLKFAAADLSSIKKNSFDQKKEHWRINQRRDQSEERANKESANEKRETKKVQEAPKTTNYYRALPTVSGLKLDQSLLSKLCEMGFDRA